MSAADLVTIRDGGLTARIDPHGAELRHLSDAEGREYMTSGDPRWWAGHAPLLFPIVGALNGGIYRLGAREYALPKHGFARTSRFEIADQTPNSVRFRLADSETSRAVYPFTFALDAEFALGGATLAVTATIHNTGAGAMPFSFGFHPAFAWPVPDGGAKDAHRIVFARAEPEPVRRINLTSALLLPDPEPTPVRGRELAPDASMFAADALIWDRLHSRSLRFAGETGAGLEIAFPDSPNLGVWQKPGAPFLAIEPWQGYNDPVGFTGDFRDKPGVVSLDPGSERRFRLRITLDPA